MIAIGPVLGDHLIEARAIEDVAPLERSPLDGPLMPGDEAVVRDGQIACARERLAGV